MLQPATVTFCCSKNRKFSNYLQQPCPLWQLLWPSTSVNEQFSHPSFRVYLPQSHCLICSKAFLFFFREPGLIKYVVLTWRSLGGKECEWGLSSLAILHISFTYLRVIAWSAAELSFFFFRGALDCCLISFWAGLAPAVHVVLSRPRQSATAVL